MAIEIRWMGIATLAAIACTGATAVIGGCSSSKWSGDWTGTLKPSAKKKAAKASQYSETKPSMTDTLTLNGNGEYTAKFREINYTGDWTDGGSTITLKPKTYMGMSKDAFPATKKGNSASDIGSLFKPFVLETSADGKTLTHTDDTGVVTFIKS